VLLTGEPGIGKSRIGREQGMSVHGTARGIIKSCQIESCARLKTPRLLLLRDGDSGKECILGIRRIALEQNLGAAAMQETVAPVFCCLTCEG
jgi:hypothetical protein